MFCVQQKRNNVTIQSKTAKRGDLFVEIIECIALNTPGLIIYTQFCTNIYPTVVPHMYRLLNCFDDQLTCMLK